MQFKITKKLIADLHLIFKNKDEECAVGLLNEMHPADIADLYNHISQEEAIYLFLILDGEKAADVLAEIEEDQRIKFLKGLPSEVIAERFIEYMDSDDAADILGDLPEETTQEVLSQLKDVDHSGDIVDLLAYDEDTAGGLMGKELIDVNENWTISNCLDKIRSEANEIDEFYMLYVIDDDGIFKGIVSLKELLLNSPKTLISGIIDNDVKTVKTDLKDEAVANLMDKYDLVSLPVVDSIGRLVGRITIDDVVDVIREEAEKDYQMISGITEDVEHQHSIWLSARSRIPWLFIGLLGGILGAQVIGKYEIDLGIYPEMAFFIPLITAMAGNVGVQSSSIIVQGLANNSIMAGSTFRKLSREFIVGLFNAIVFGLLIFGYNYFVGEGFALTLTVSSALFSVIIFASLFGTLVPLVLDRFKIDPAVATGPFITTVNDITGLFIYLMIGRLLFALLQVSPV